MTGTAISVGFEARQLTDDADWEAIAAWCGGRVDLREIADSGECYGVLSMPVPGRNPDYPEGWQVAASEDDWVIRDADGTFRMCSPAAFSREVYAVLRSVLDITDPGDDEEPYPPPDEVASLDTDVMEDL